MEIGKRREITIKGNLGQIFHLVKQKLSQVKIGKHYKSKVLIIFFRSNIIIVNKYSK